MTTIYVGNLSFNATEQDVRSLFERHGKVDSVKLIMDRETGKPRGFGFVDMEQNEAQAAIQALNGHQMNGRPLRVNEAQERPQRPRQGGGPFPVSYTHLLLLRELQQMARVRQALELERQQHTPGVWTAAAPVQVDRHMSQPLQNCAIVTVMRLSRKCVSAENGSQRIMRSTCTPR